MARVGFIGLGDQGAPMAEMIARSGFRLDVWARRPDATAPFESLGATVHASPADLGQVCDVVGLCVLDDAGVEQVALDQGLLDAMTPGSALLVHSTVLPRTCRRLAEVAAARGVAVLDAPVSGGRAGALNGSLSVMVGGDAAAFERVLPVLQTYGNPVRHVGDVGTAQMIKLVNNALFVAHVGLAGAAHRLAETCGVDPATLFDVVATSSGSSTGLQAFTPLTTTDWGRHAWTVLRKDVALFEALESSAGDTPSAIATLAAQAVERFGTAATSPV